MSNVSDEPSHATLDSFAQFVWATLIAGLVYFVAFMALDYFVVRMRPYPDEVHDYDFSVYLFPILSGLVLLYARRSFLPRLSMAQLIGAIFAGVLVAVPLIATVGVSFHFAIGGRL